MSAVDFSILEQFCELLGDDGKAEACELINLYLEDAPIHIEVMKKSLITQDTEAFRRAAHTLKSSSANVGGLDLQTLCQTMETAAVNGSIDPLKESLDLAEAQFNQVKAELQQWATS